VLEGLRGTRARVFLFGSWARGEPRFTSDIDVAVQGDAALPPGLLPRIRRTLEESTVPYRVDLVDLAEADPRLRQPVLEEGVPWVGG